MRIDYILAICCAAVAAVTLTYLLVRAAVGVARETASSHSALRSLLALPAACFLRRAAADISLKRNLDRLDKLIVQAGGTFLDGASAAEVFAAKFVLPLLGASAVIVIGVLLRVPSGLVLLGFVFFAVLLYAYPETALKAAAAERTRIFTHELPGTLDIMRLVSQSGGDLYMAIRDVISVTPKNPVRDELARAVAEVAIGTSLPQALNNIAERVGTSEANAVFTTLAQSLEMGTSVSENLASAASLIRHSARVKAQTKAQKAVVNMSFPLLLLILPGIFIVLFAPIVIQYVNR